MHTGFFPPTCQWLGTNKKTGDWQECTKPWTDIVEDDLEVYCHSHYELIMKNKEKNEHV